MQRSRSLISDLKTIIPPTICGRTHRHNYTFTFPKKCLIKIYFSCTSKSAHLIGTVRYIPWCADTFSSFCYRECYYGYRNNRHWIDSQFYRQSELMEKHKKNHEVKCQSFREVHVRRWQNEPGFKKLKKIRWQYFSFHILVEEERPTKEKQKE